MVEKATKRSGTWPAAGTEGNVETRGQTADAGDRRGTRPTHAAFRPGSQHEYVLRYGLHRGWAEAVLKRDASKVGGP